MMTKTPLKLNIRTVNKLLSSLNDRSRDVIERRFGIGKSQNRQTLEAIGQSYGITRERVRQIEEQSLKKVRTSSNFKEIEGILDDLKNLINNRGGVVCEKTFLDEVASSSAKGAGGDKNYLHFLLVLGEDFERLKENDNFHVRWTTDKDRAEEAHESLHSLHQKLDPDEVFNEEDLIVHFANYIKNNSALTPQSGKPSAEVLRSWLYLSRLLAKNMLDEWGFIASPQIKPRGVKDLAYLVMKQHGSPMHFTEVASAIEKNLSLGAHPQTVHNELIKDNRFVLVGRGLYALISWGYKPGLIRDVIKNILSSSSSLSKEVIIKKVLKERYVKENTILINLHNRSFFRKNGDGTYSVA